MACRYSVAVRWRLEFEGLNAQNMEVACPVVEGILVERWRRFGEQGGLLLAGTTGERLANSWEDGATKPASSSAFPQRDRDIWTEPTSTFTGTFAGLY